MIWRALRHPLFIGLLALFGSAPASAAPEQLPEKEEADISAGLDKPPQPIDRSTPRRAWASYLQACQEGRWESAAHLLNLGDVPLKDRKVMGPVLARQLCELLRTVPPLAAESLEDTALGPLRENGPRNFTVVARLPGPGGPEEVWLRRFRDARSGQHLWLLTRQTVSQIPGWYRRQVKRQQGERPALEQVNSLGALPGGHTAADPRSAVRSFLDLTRKGRFVEAARLLDLSQLAADQHAERGARLARRLAIVLRQLHPAGYTTLSNDPQGAPERDVPFDEEHVTGASLEGSSLSVRLARYPRRQGGPIWLFGAETVASIDPLYGRYGYGWPGDHLPPFFIEWKLLGVQLWQWLGIGLALVVAIMVGYLGSFLLRRFLQRLTSATRWAWDDPLVSKLRGPLWIGLAVLIFTVQEPFLNLAETPHGFLRGTTKLLAILALGWFVVRVIDAVGDHVLAYFKERGDDMGMAMVPVARKILKPIIIAIMAVVALQNIGMNVGGLLAGLGIGGLAIALAGKNTLENLFGSIVISFDRPFRIGDFIKVGDLIGTVEDLGLRSTRVRTLDRTLVTIPNAQMADSRVENYTRRDRMRLFTTIAVQYDTQMDQLRLIVDEIKRYLLAHPRVWQDSFSVRFVGFGDSSLNIEVMAWVTTADWTEFTGIREGMLMELHGIVERAGAVFAYPSRTIYAGKASDADAERAQQAAATVAARRQAGELTLPAIPESVRQSLQARPPQP